MGQFEYIPTEDLENLEDLTTFTTNVKNLKEKLIDSTGIPKELLNNKKEVEELDYMTQLELLED